VTVPLAGRVRERAGALRLRLHPERTRLYRTSDPVAFLGVARFMLDVDRHAGVLSRELASGQYRPSVGRCFRTEDPKLRWLYVLPFRDHVAQHLLIAQTLTAVERGMAPQSYPYRVGRERTGACGGRWNSARVDRDVADPGEHSLRVSQSGAPRTLAYRSKLLRLVSPG